jgi:hypothetical protein
VTTVDTSKEVVRSHLVVTRAAAWMADWSTFVDEPDYQDPEVAVADGYSDIPLPPGALSVAALAIDALSLDDVRAGRVQRVWEGAQPVVVGTPLRARITTGYGTVTTRFETLDGTTVATERISVLDAPLDDGAPDGPTAFGTGPIDLTRVRALSWSLGEIDPDRQWAWGREPEVVRALGQRLVAPALVAGRAVVSGKDAPRRIAALTVRTTAAAADMGSSLTAEVVSRNGSAAEVAVSADGRLLAAVSVQLRD